MKPIETLSKEELLSLIYHNLPRTLFFDHPCICGSCGTQDPNHLVSVNGKVVVPYGYVCDNCEGNLED